VGVYDISRTGIAIVDDRPMEVGTPFSVLLPRSGQHPVEMICTARHSRPLNGAFVTGARYGSDAYTSAAPHRSSFGSRSGSHGSIADVLRAKGAGPVA
jgi:hypothetical protein